MIALSLPLAFLAFALAVLAAPSALGTSLATRAGAPAIQNIHPLLARNKCMGIVGGIFANGSQVDIFDCNDSKSQEWQLFPGGTGSDPLANTFVTTPDVIQDAFCLDAGDIDQIANGVKVKIWKCFDGLPQQQWIPIQSGQIALGTGGFCLDLTDGNTENRNVLQLWSCAGGNENQVWIIGD